MPVFFVTDRNLRQTKSGDVDFGPDRKYVGECKHDPFMGSAYCVVANVDGKPLTDHLKEMGWTRADSHDKLKDFKATLVSGSDFDKIEKDFYSQVHAKASLTEDKNLLVFAHGFRNSFRSALPVAARLTYDSERPIIFYSWPSTDEIRGYSSDENNIEWSQEHFNDVVTHLEALCLDDPSIKVRMFAHSMGTRLLVRATPILREKSYLAEAALICPDVDDGLVKHYARRYLSGNGTAKIRIYMSRRDKALPLSQLLHGGYNRLGEQADAMGSWVGKILSGEQAQENPDETKAAEAEFAERLKLTQKRMQTIDFTAIDKGLVGHNVPDHLVCSMSFTNTPGPGLRFEAEDSGKRSKLSNMFTKMAKLKSTDDQVLTGTVLCVMKDDDKSHSKLHKKSRGKQHTFVPTPNQ